MTRQVLHKKRPRWIVVVVAAAAIVLTGFDAGRRVRQDDHHDERLDLGRPAGRAAGEKVRQTYAGNVGFRLLQGGSDVGVSDVAEGRVTSATPRASRSRPIRADWCSTRSPRTRSASSPATATRSRTSTRTAQAMFGGNVRELGAGARRERARERSTWSSARRHPEPRTRSRRSSWHEEDLLRRQPEGVERARPAVGQGDPNARSATCRSRSPTGSTRRLQGRRLQPAEREVRPVRRSAQLLHGHPRCTRGRAKKFIKWVAESKDAAKIITTEWVPLKLSGPPSR